MDVRDRSGIIQIVFDEKDKSDADGSEKAAKLRT